MKAFVGVLVVIVTSLLLETPKAEMVKRVYANVVEVIDPGSKSRADRFVKGIAAVQFFAKNSYDWDFGKGQMNKAAMGLPTYYFLSYNCVIVPEYCPGISETTYRYLIHGKVKKTESGEAKPYGPVAETIKKVYYNL